MTEKQKADISLISMAVVSVYVIVSSMIEGGVNWFRLGLGLLALGYLLYLLYFMVAALLLNPIRRLRRTLPKCGFEIVQQEWDDTKTELTIYGTCHDEKIFVMAYKDHMVVHFVDQPWYKIPANDPDTRHLVESVNIINSQRSCSRVFLTEPNEKNERLLVSACATVLPTMKLKEFINGTLADLLGRKEALARELKVEKPWISSCPGRGPIGFAAQADTTSESDTTTTPE